MTFVHLHTHSHFSLLDGACQIEELVAEAARQQMPALALTDHNALYGALRFHDECRRAGIKPIIGMELNVVGGFTLVLLARDIEGYRNLCRLSSALQGSADREAALQRGADWDLLDRCRAGIIALSAGPRGEVDAHLRRGEMVEAVRVAGRLSEVFGPENALLELQIHHPDDETLAVRLAMVGRRAGLRCVATNNVHYLDDAGRERRRVLLAMQHGVRVEAPQILEAMQADTRFTSEAEMAERFGHFPAALAQSWSVAERCAVEFPKGQIVFPSVDLPADIDAGRWLEQVARQGLTARLGELSPAVESRLAHELSVIQQLGYAGYFLVVADIVAFARRAHIPFSSRGSASSSLVVFALGISDVNPLDHDLYFERFLNLARREPPDIDLDFCSHRRDEVIDYVYRRFGADKVAMVCTYSTFRSRSALREVAKAYGIGDDRVEELVRYLPRYRHPSASDEVQQAQAELTAEASDPIEQRALEMSRQLEGYPRHLSIHPGGIVIAPTPLTDWVGVQTATKGLLVTQLDGAGVERLGLLKIDLLGIRGLSVVQSTADKVRLLHEPDFDLATIPDEDEETGRLLAAGRTLGCFQLESAGMRETLRSLHVENVAGITAAISLYRPGPLRGGLRDAFVRRHTGQEAVKYLHPSLEPILHETYGVILYQEQVLRVAHEIAGMSLEQADVIRRSMTRFRSSQEMQGLREEFIAGAWRTSGIPPEVARRIWRLMESFAGYGFPKAHAVGYAVVAYRCAYLKAHYPAEFMASRLADWGGYYPQVVYLNEARRMGLTLRPPHVNHSGGECTLEYEGGRAVLWLGLDQVRDLTQRTIEATLAEREKAPFCSLDDWLVRVRPRRQEAENLVRVGGLDGLGAGRRALLRQLDWSAPRTTAGQLPLPLLEASQEESSDFTRLERLKAEEELLGVIVSEHPLARRWEAVAQYHPVAGGRLAEYVGQEVVVAGMRVTAWRHRTTKGETMLFLTLEDLDDMMDVVVLPAVYERRRKILSRAGPFMVWGRVEMDMPEGGATPIVIARDVRLVAGREG